MKKVFLYGTAIATALLTGYSVYDAHNKAKMPRMLLANVEALADEAGEATKVGTCYLKMPSCTYEWKIFCNEKTDNHTIYPCPNTDSYGGFSDMAQDRCTK